MNDAFEAIRLCDRFGRVKTKEFLRLIKWLALFCWPVSDMGGAVISASNTLQLFQLLLQPLLETTLHQIAEVIHQGVGHRIDQPRTIALTAHQPRPLQLAQLAADVGLAEASGLDQGGHIHGPAMLELAEQLQAGGFAQQPEEGAEFIKQLGTRQGLGQCPAHGRAYVDTRIMHSAHRPLTSGVQRTGQPSSP